MTSHALQWHHNEHDAVSNRQPHDCLLNLLFRRKSKKTSKLHVTGLCEGNFPVPSEFPAQRASNAEKFPFDDVIMWASGLLKSLATQLLIQKLVPASNHTGNSLFIQQFIRAGNQENTEAPYYWPFMRGIHQWLVDSPHKWPVMWKEFPCHEIMWRLVYIVIWIIWCQSAITFHSSVLLSWVLDLFDRNKILSGGDLSHYQVPHCIRVFFYFVWFVFIHHNFQSYFELCTYCNILDIYLS